MWQCVSAVIKSIGSKYTMLLDGTIARMVAAPLQDFHEDPQDPLPAKIRHDLLWQVYLPIGIAVAAAGLSAVALGNMSLSGMLYSSMLADALLTMLLMFGMVAGLLSLAVMVVLVWCLGNMPKALTPLLEHGREHSRRARVVALHRSESLRQDIERNRSRLATVVRWLPRRWRWLHRAVRDRSRRSNDVQGY